jgi:hypothetical protein
VCPLALVVCQIWREEPALLRDLVGFVEVFEFVTGIGKEVAFPELLVVDCGFD